MGMPLSKRIDVPPLWLLVCLAVAWWQVRHWPVGPEPGGLSRLAGAVFVAIGLALTVSAVVAFVRHRTSVVPHTRPKAMIADGVFALTRNPIYLGDALVLLGLCLWWGAWPSLALVPVFVLWIDRHFIRDEEARLRAAFGTAFDDYAARVRRWV